MHNLKLGLFGIGLDTYWPQFPGLKNLLEKNLSVVCDRLSVNGVSTVNAGLVDSLESSDEAAVLLSEARVDAVVLYVTTYALSSTVLPLVQHLNVPLLVCSRGY